VFRDRILIPGDGVCVLTPFSVYGQEYVCTLYQCLFTVLILSIPGIVPTLCQKTAGRPATVRTTGTKGTPARSGMPSTEGKLDATNSRGAKNSSGARNKQQRG
jgi:hypothetical protein